MGVMLFGAEHEGRIGWILGVGQVIRVGKLQWSLSILNTKNQPGAVHEIVLHNKSIPGNIRKSLG